jgi:hypothetical protein
MMDKVEQSSDYIRHSVSAIEKKVDAEMHLRVQGEEELKIHFTGQLQTLATSMQHENGASLEREKKLMLQMNQGLS